MVDKIKQKTQCEMKVEDYKEIVLWNSGKSVEQMGLFDDCVQQQLMKFGFLSFFNKTTMLPLGLQMGLCLPKICTKTQIQQFANMVISNSTLPVVTQYIQQPQNITPEIGAVFIITLILLIIYTLTLLASTFFEKMLPKNKVLDSFNLKKNLVTFQHKPHNFNVFNGVKSLCMMWVILGHTFSARLQNSVNALTFESTLQGPFFLWVLSAFFAVDVFFYIGGFLVAYSFLRNKMKSNLKYPLAILHRVLRFWPSYIMAMLIFYGFMIHVGSGPLWYKATAYSQYEECRNMWKSIFFVDNIVDNGEKMCMGWGWYLQNDMQIFILSIPILFLYNVNRKASYITIASLIAISLLINFLEVQLNGYITVAHRPDFAEWGRYFPNVYIKPWIRCPPYLYGLILGLLYMEFKQQQKNTDNQSKGFYMKIKQKFQANENLRRGVQFAGLGIVLFVIYIVRTLQVGHVWPEVFHAFYLTFGKLFFVIGVSMMVTPSILGITDNMVHFLMDTKLFNFIGKISFWTYLIHYNFIVIVFYSQRLDFYYTVRTVFQSYVPIAIISMFFGFLGTVLIELPFANMQKLLFKKNKDQGETEKPKLQHFKLKPTVMLNQSVNSQLDLKGSVDN